MSRRRAAPADPKLAVAYVRMSTDRQDLSPDAQRAAIERWASVQGVAVVAWHDDLGVSGGAAIEDRPGLTGALDALKATGAGTLVVARMDRLARDVLATALTERLCERIGARVQSADGVGNAEGPEAQLMRNMVAAFAMYERALIRARTKGALAVLKAKGRRTGGIPMGTRVVDGKRLEANDVEAAAVARARELRGIGRSLREIATALASEGHAPRGRRWHIQTISRVVGSAWGRHLSSARQ